MEIFYWKKELEKRGRNWEMKGSERRGDSRNQSQEHVAAAISLEESERPRPFHHFGRFIALLGRSLVAVESLDDPMMGL